MSAPIELSRPHILAFRRRVGSLDLRMPAAAASLRQAAWAGLQDSMPRAALLSIHARVEGVESEIWDDATLIQLWGPRYQVYVVAEQDLPVFALGRYPDEARARHRADDLAERLREHLDGRSTTYGEAGRAIGVNPNALRYAATTGTVAIRWAGARAPTVWTLPRPSIDPFDARLELARRYLHVYGPTTAAAFAKWAGITARMGAAAFQGLDGSLTAVRTPIGESFILSSDEDGFRAPPDPAAPARLLPSGDAYYLLHGEDRALPVADVSRRGELWTPRVWPGALLVDGEVRGTWRRANEAVTVQAWGKLTRAQRDAVEAEAAALPLPGLDREITTTWEP
jgi:hypothetical protein